MNINGEEYYLRTFEDLLYDSVYLLYFAFDTNQDNYADNVISPFIRSSILNSVLLLECGANCLIDSLNISKGFYNDIEKLPLLSKFEFFLSNINSKKNFDRGCKEVQAVAELKSIRDFYVHPKVKKGEFKSIGENLWSVDFGETNSLHLPRDARSWAKKHAILALKSTNDFYNKYFTEWCEFEADVVVDLLLGSDKVDIKRPIGAYIDVVGGLDRAVKEWDIDFRFLGKIVADEG